MASSLKRNLRRSLGRSREPLFPNLRAFVDSHHRSVTQSEIAEKLGLTPGLLSGYLGGRPPGREMALRISREHSIDLEGLLDPPVEDAVSA